MSDNPLTNPIIHERAILGLLVDSPESVSLCGDLDAAHFFDPRHSLVFTAVLAAVDLPVAPDRNAVLDCLTRAGQLSRVGGAPFLASLLTGGGSTIANLGYYAQHVRRAAARRELVVYAERLAIAITSVPDFDDVADLAGEWGATVEQVAQVAAGAQRPIVGLHDVADRVFTPGATQWVIPGLLARGERVINVASEGAGKLLRVDEPVPTPHGWTAMGLLRCGDQVFDRHGQPCSVTGVSPVELNPDAWTVVFSDGSRIDADVGHQWVTVDYASRQPGRGAEAKPHTTGEIRDTLRVRDGRVLNHAVPVAGELVTPDVHLLVKPYTLGVWLGDGTTADPSVTLSRRDAPAILAGIAADGYWARPRPSGEKPGSRMFGLIGVRPLMRSLAVLGDKRIPDVYLRAGVEQRRALLRGLMDTDGYVASRTGYGRGQGAATCELTLTCKTLVDGAVELITSLGVKATVRESDAVLGGRVVGRRWRIVFQCPFNPFTVPFKAQRWMPLRTARARYRYIVDVVPAEASPMRCITVNSPDRTYLAGRSMIPTHNSTLLRQVAFLAAWGRHPFLPEVAIRPVRSLVVDLENPEAIIDEEEDRFRSAHQRVLGVPAPRGAMLWTHPEGLDLRRRSDEALLDRVLAKTRPELVTLGPLYKAFRRDSKDSDGSAGEFLAALDRLRVRHGFALVCEHHAPLGEGYAGRQMRPFGSMLLQAWPEFGFGWVPPDVKAPDILEVSRFRRDREQNRDWPDALYRDVRWPLFAHFPPGVEQRIRTRCGVAAPYADASGGAA